MEFVFNDQDETLSWSPQQNATPIYLQFGDGNDEFQLFEQCDIPCLYDNGPDGVVAARYVTHLPDRSFWKFIFSMEGPQYYPNLIVDNSDHWQENQFYSTTSYRSDIPLPYYSRAEFDIWQNDYVPFDVGIKGGAFLARNCGSRNDRESLLTNMIDAVKSISEMSNTTSHALRIDSLSDCVHSADPPSNLDLEDKRHPLAVRQVQEDNVWHMQDNVTRFTVAVASNRNETVVNYDSEGNFLNVDIATSMQIRILVEDLDMIHVGADQVETYFGRLMTDDFYHPIQLYTDIPIQ